MLSAALQLHKRCQHKPLERAVLQAHDSALLWMKSLSSESKLFVPYNIYGEL